MDASELKQKQAKLSAFLDKHSLDGVVLWNRNNFAWITGGGDNHIVNSGTTGFGAIYATRDKRYCLANAIELPRFRDETLNTDKDIEFVTWPWYDDAAGQKTIRDLLDPSKVAADVNSPAVGFKPLPGDFDELRWSLAEAEIHRYRDGGRRTADAIERCCHAIKPGMTEHEVAGLMDHEVRNAGMIPEVTLVAADARISHFRHPPPTGFNVHKHVMVVTCANLRGLISNVTRFVSFGKLPDDIKAKHQAVCNIDATVNYATQPGRTLGEVFNDLTTAYAAAGYADEWPKHHQGGSTGYAGRERLGVPGSPVKVLPSQAFAWNPSITGTKSEDTIVLTSNGFEILTPHSNDWPTVIGRCAAGEMRRADHLQR